MRRASYCHACRREVLWTVTDAGKRLAVNPQPDPAGNTAAFCDGQGIYRSRRPTDELPPAGWEKTYMPHAATCVGRRKPTAPTELPPGVADMAAYRRKLRGETAAPARQTSSAPASSADAAGQDSAKARRHPARSKQAAPGQSGLW